VFLRVAAGGAIAVLVLVAAICCFCLFLLVPRSVDFCAGLLAGRPVHFSSAGIRGASYCCCCHSLLFFRWIDARAVWTPSRRRSGEFLNRARLCCCAHALHALIRRCGSPSTTVAAIDGKQWHVIHPLPPQESRR
jgi:hypothetical protein